MRKKKKPHATRGRGGGGEARKHYHRGRGVGRLEHKVIKLERRRKMGKLTLVPVLSRGPGGGGGVAALPPSDLELDEATNEQKEEEKKEKDEKKEQKEEEEEKWALIVPEQETGTKCGHVHRACRPIEFTNPPDEFDAENGMEMLQLFAFETEEQSTLHCGACIRPLVMADLKWWKHDPNNKTKSGRITQNLLLTCRKCPRPPTCIGCGDDLAHILLDRSSWSKLCFHCFSRCSDAGYRAASLVF